MHAFKHVISLSRPVSVSPCAEPSGMHSHLSVHAEMYGTGVPYTTMPTALPSEKEDSRMGAS